MQVFRPQGGEVTVEWMLLNEDGERDLLHVLPAGDGTLRETHRDRNTIRPPPAGRPHYVAAKEVGVSTWPDTYIFLGGDGELDVPGITRSTPVFDREGALLGVLTAEFDLRALSRYMRTVELGEEGIVLLLEVRQDGKLRVIAHPDAPENLELAAPAKDGRGSEYRLDYTAIGDAVNLASRLEGLNRVYGTGILMSETVHADVSDRVVTRMLDRVAAKGRTGGTTIYELIGLPDDVSEDSLELIARYEEALQRYFARDFEGAVAGFREVLARVPEDGPAAVLCARSEIYLDQPPPADWGGIFAHHTK